MGSNYLPETVGSVLPAPFPWTESWSPSAEERETRIKFDWLAESLIDLGRLNRSRTRFTMSPPFFFAFFAAMDEGWSAMEMRVGVLNEPRHCMQITQARLVSHTKSRFCNIQKYLLEDNSKPRLRSNSQQRDKKHTHTYTPGMKCARCFYSFITFSARLSITSMNHRILDWIMSNTFNVTVIFSRK